MKVIKSFIALKMVYTPVLIDFKHGKKRIRFSAVAKTKKEIRVPIPKR